MLFELPERFEKKISPEPNSGCWLWTGAIDGKGYGRAKILGTRVNVPVHRAIYELAFGSVDNAFVLDHRCQLRCCCNPDHLEVVTHRENILRGTAPSARHAIKLFCDNGHILPAPNGKPRRCHECSKSNNARYYKNNRAAIRKRRGLRP